MNNQNDLPEQGEPQESLTKLTSSSFMELIKDNVLISFDRLVGKLSDTPIVHLEQIAKNEQKVENTLQTRALRHFLDKIIREQQNHECVMEIAIKELLLNPPTKKPKKVIDRDWLSYFEDLASAKSNETLQMFLGKILATEIKQPDSFNLRTLNTLYMLDQETIQIFQAFCNLSIMFSKPYVIYEPFGGVLNNEMADFGLSYSALARLRDSKLIYADFATVLSVEYARKDTFYKIGGSTFKFHYRNATHRDLDSISKVTVKALKFTEVGEQVRGLMTLQSHKAYNTRMKTWLGAKFKAVVEEANPEA